MSIEYNENDMKNAPLFNQVFDFVGARDVSDDDVWEVARKYESCPNMADVYYEVAYKRLIDTLSDSYGIDVSDVVKVHINAADTSLTVNGETVFDVVGFITNMRVWALENNVLKTMDEDKKATFKNRFVIK